MTGSAQAHDKPFTVYALSEKAVTVEFGHEINDLTGLQVRGFDRLVHDQPFPGFITTVPAYASVTIYYDPLLVHRSGLPGKDGFDKVAGYLRRLQPVKQSADVVVADPITIPVCYGGSFGPDLADLALLYHLDADEVISMHTAAIYKVHMIGFVPGFAYLGGMDASLAAPRKLTPAKAVPAGSVGIAGMQTGIYPLQTPGGWQIIGQTPVKMFDAGRAQPSLLKAGDRVVFKSISTAEFNEIKALQNEDRDH